MRKSKKTLFIVLFYLLSTLTFFYLGYKIGMVQGKADYMEELQRIHKQWSVPEPREQENNI
ncbi:MAG TPA: hypothetical protein ACFCUD_02155 [Cyclobacteriaceae bacterium]